MIGLRRWKTGFGTSMGLALMVVAGIAASQDAGRTAVELNAEGVQAYQAKDYARFLELEKRALAADPENPRWAYNVACGEALRGDAPAAVRVLDGLVARQVDLGAETDGDFAGIRQTAEWREFATRLAELRKPVERSQTAFTLDDPGLVATGVAVDSRTGDVYVTSVRERKIVRRTRAGKVSDFVRQGQDGFLAGAGLAIDARRGLLYASTAAAPFMAGYQKEDAGKAGVFAFDLKTGRTVRKVWLEAAKDGEGPHFLNNMVVDRSGTVLVSNSGSPGVYRWTAGSHLLELLSWSKAFRSTQGMALLPDERTLFMTDWSDGVWAVDLASGERQKIEGPAGVWLGGLDGLTPVRGGFIAVQIGVKPDRVVRLRLDRDHIAAVEVLERNRPEYAEPVQGTQDGKDFLYVANSQLNLVDRTGAFPVERGKGTVVLRLRVE
jgi:sugar lactone lactonase YvrE